MSEAWEGDTVNEEGIKAAAKAIQEMPVLARPDDAFFLRLARAAVKAYLGVVE